MGEQIEITEPGVYNIPAEQYHADPVPGRSLSSSGARKLLATCPARFRYEQTHPEPSTRPMNLGTAAHRMVLGAGADLEEIKYDSYRTKAAQQARDEARAAGKTPLLTAEHDQVRAMADAIRRHPWAGALFDPARGGKPEQALFWRDQAACIWRRALLDWLPPVAASGRLIIPDYKTTHAADPESLPRLIHQHGYHMQATWYLDAARALGLNDTPQFVLVFQETDPPYLVNVVQLDPVALRIGRDRNRRAINLYQHCAMAGEWPGYSDDVGTISLPPWAENRHTEEEFTR